MSPWVVAWESIRYAETQPIRDAFPKSMHGARNGCERYGVSLDLALEIEEAHLKALEMCGISVDKAKFFHTLSRELCYELMKRWGVPASYIRAIKGLYDNGRFIYKLDGIVSEEGERLGVFFRGCRARFLQLSS